MSDETTTQATETTGSSADTVDFAERYKDILGKVNETLDKVDWSQAGRIGKVVGIFAAVIVAQILIKGILDTINLLPVVPGLLELLGDHTVEAGGRLVEEAHVRRGDQRARHGEAPLHPARVLARLSLIHI